MQKIMQDKFTSLTDLAKAFESTKKKLESKKFEVLTEIGSHVQKKVKGKYGVHQPGWAISTTNPDTPLVDTGKLKESIKYTFEGDNKVVIAPENKRIHKKITAKELVLVHEYGTGRIPARPLWDRIIPEEEKNIVSIVEKIIDDIF